MCVWLPPRKEAITIFENYASNLHHLQLIVHIPKVRSLIDDLYIRLDQGQQAEPSHVALVLSILAATAFHWIPNWDDGSVFSTIDDAAQASLFWTSAAHKVSD